MVLSEEDNSSKVKRRKTVKTESQTDNSAVHTIAPKSGTTKTDKPPTKVGEPSNTSKSPGGMPCVRSINADLYFIIGYSLLYMQVNSKQ